MAKYNRTLFWITIFSLGMAFLESAVVVYLREIAYPYGFTFPLVPLDTKIAITEVFRELATIVMLVGISAALSKKFSVGFAWFIYCFAIWDIFYYVFLKLLLNWPSSLLTWDILFLIPVAWVGPVIAPIILSFTMIGLCLIILYSDIKNSKSKLIAREWWIFIVGSLAVILSFTLDYIHHINSHESLGKLFSSGNSDEMVEIAYNYVPQQFDWWIFTVGQFILIGGIYIYYIRNFKKSD